MAGYHLLREAVVATELMSQCGDNWDEVSFSEKGKPKIHCLSVSFSSSSSTEAVFVRLFACFFLCVCLIKRFDVELEGTIGDSHAGTLRRRVTL